MKKTISYIFIVLLLVTDLITLAGCSDETQNFDNQIDDRIEENSYITVGKLNFYVPDDFTYRKDLSSTENIEDEKKIFVSGDYENDPDDTITIVAYTLQLDKTAKQYTDEINEKLGDVGVKYLPKTNDKLDEIYAREDYEVRSTLNYSYIIDSENVFYIVDISGPIDKESTLREIANKVFVSLDISIISLLELEM